MTFFKIIVYNKWEKENIDFNKYQGSFIFQDLAIFLFIYLEI